MWLGCLWPLTFFNLRPHWNIHLCNICLLYMLRYVHSQHCNMIFFSFVGCNRFFRNQLEFNEFVWARYCLWNALSTCAFCFQVYGSVISHEVTTYAQVSWGITFKFTINGLIYLVKMSELVIYGFRFGQNVAYKQHSITIIQARLKNG